MNPRNTAARAGRWSAQHRRAAILGWFAFVVLATVAGGVIGTKSLQPAQMGNGSSKAADVAVDRAGFRQTSGEQVLLQARGGLAGPPELHTAAPELTARHRQGPPGHEARPPYAAGGARPAPA